MVRFTDETGSDLNGTELSGFRMVMEGLQFW